VEYRPAYRDRTPDKTQRLLNHASWDTFAAMGVVRRFAVAGLEEAARHGKRRGWPAEHLQDPAKSLVMGLPLDLQFRTRGQLATGIRVGAYADGIRFDFACGDEVYGNCTGLRDFFEDNGQAYVLRVPSNFTLTLAAGTKMTCVEAVKTLLTVPQTRQARRDAEIALVS
jgi:hypothetical protein